MTKKELLGLSNTQLDDTIKIQGTSYDRKRKLSAIQKRNAKSMVNSGKTVSSVAEHFGVSSYCINYNTDEAFKENVKKYYRKGAHGTGPKDFSDRVAYKRSLVEAGKTRNLTIVA